MDMVLSVVETAYRANLEEQDDTVLWVNTMFLNGGLDLSILLRSNAVNYAVRGQDASGLRFGEATQSNPPKIEEDVSRIVQKGAPVYAVKEDLQERGISGDGLIDGIQLISRAEIPRLFDEHEQVWHW